MSINSIVAGEVQNLLTEIADEIEIEAAQVTSYTMSMNEEEDGRLSPISRVVVETDAGERIDIEVR